MSTTRLAFLAGALLLALTGCTDPCNGACGSGESCLSNGDTRIPIISPTFGGTNNETYSCKPTPPFFGTDTVAGVGVVVVVADGGCSIEADADAGACAVCIETACCAVAAACPADGGADAGCAPLDQCASERCATDCPGVP